MVDYDRTFTSTFSVEEVYTEPDGIPEYEFLAPGAATAAPVISIEVTLEDSSRWRGLIYGGAHDANLLANTPNPNVLLAIGNGIAYTIPVQDPGGYVTLSLRPVRSIMTIDPELLVLVGYTRLLGIGPDGSERWVTQRLVADGFYDVSFLNRTILIRGWDRELDRDIEATIDIATGNVLTRG